MEAVAAVGAVASFTQLVEMCLTLVRRSREYYSSALEMPKTFRSLATHLPVLITILGNIKSQLENGGVDNASQEAIVAVVEDCRAEVESLQNLLTRLLPHANDTGWKRGRKIVLSLSNDKKIDQIVVTVQRHLQILTTYQVSILPVLIEKHSRSSVSALVSETKIQEPSGEAVTFQKQSFINRITSDTTEDRIQNSDDDPSTGIVFPKPEESLAERSTNAFSVLDIPQSICPKSCTCACHWQRLFRSPEALEWLVGRVQLKSSGPWWKPGGCDLRSCLMRSTYSQIQGHFVFPQWLLSRAVSFFLRSHVLGGPVVGIRAPRLVNPSSMVFHYAILGQIDTLQSLFASSLASPFDTSCGELNTPLSAAAMNGQDSTCQFLICQGADLEQCDAYGRSAVSYAILRYLARRNTNQSTNVFQETFNISERDIAPKFNRITQAVLEMSNEKLQDVLQDPDSVLEIDDEDEMYSWTPIEWASSRADVAAVRLLLSSGADPTWVPVRLAFSRTTDEADLGEILAMVLEAGVSLAPVNSDTALHVACRLRSFEFIRTLLEAGADASIRDTNGLTPLHDLVAWRKEHNTSLLRLLVKHGADPDAFTNKGNSVLHLLLGCEHTLVRFRCVQYLIEAGADPWVCDPAGYLPIELAIKFQDDDLVCDIFHLLFGSPQFATIPEAHNIFISTFYRLMGQRKIRILQRIVPMHDNFRFSYRGITILHLLAIEASMEILSIFPPAKLIDLDTGQPGHLSYFHESNEGMADPMEVVEIFDRPAAFSEAFEEFLEEIRVEQRVANVSGVANLDIPTNQEDMEETDAEHFEDTVEDQSCRP